MGRTISTDALAVLMMEHTAHLPESPSSQCGAPDLLETKGGRISCAKQMYRPLGTACDSLFLNEYAPSRTGGGKGRTLEENKRSRRRRSQAADFALPRKLFTMLSTRAMAETATKEKKLDREEASSSPATTFPSWFIWVAKLMVRA